MVFTGAVEQAVRASSTAGGGGVDRNPDLFEDRVHLQKDLLVRKPKDGESPRFEVAGAPSILLPDIVEFMDPSVQFDNEPNRQAAEVHDEWPDPVLTSETDPDRIETEVVP